MIVIALVDKRENQNRGGGLKGEVVKLKLEGINVTI